MSDAMPNEVPADENALTEDPGFLRGGWHHWTQFAQAIGVVQTRVLMVLFYVAVAVPTGIFMRLTGDRLRLQRPKDGNWVEHHAEKQSIETAKRQF